MATQKPTLLLLALLACFAAAAREASLKPNHRTLEARLMVMGSQTEVGVGGGLTECWGALLELRSCTNEILLFFLNGEAYIGQECCRAIRIITHQCWPNMLTSLGFTVEEGDILRDYCAMGTAPPPPLAPGTPPLPPPPAPAPAPAPAL